MVHHLQELMITEDRLIILDIYIYILKGIPNPVTLYFDQFMLDNGGKAGIQELDILVGLIT